MPEKPRPNACATCPALQADIQDLVQEIVRLKELNWNGKLVVEIRHGNLRGVTQQFYREIKPVEVRR